MINYTGPKKYLKIANNVFDGVIRSLKQIDKIEVDLSVVDENTIQELNRKSRKIDKVTDVLSFPFLDDIFNKKLTKKDYAIDINPETGNIMLGEIIICEKQMKRQAREYKNKVQREFAYLFCHGMLHLFGYDHMKEKDKKIMREKEEEILTSLGYTR